MCSAKNLAGDSRKQKGETLSSRLVNNDPTGSLTPSIFRRGFRGASTPAQRPWMSGPGADDPNGRDAKGCGWPGADTSVILPNLE